MAQQKFRVAGGYTSFSFAGHVFLYARTVTDTAPRPVGAGPTPIHPLGEPHPIEIAFPMATGIGTLVVEIFEQWESNVWQELPGYENAGNLLDVFAINLQRGTVQCVKTISIPGGKKRFVYYHNCVITDINETETVAVGTIEVAKSITISYTHKTRNAGS